MYKNIFKSVINVIQLFLYGGCIHICVRVCDFARLCVCVCGFVLARCSSGALESCVVGRANKNKNRVQTK